MRDKTEGSSKSNGKNFRTGHLSHLNFLSYCPIFSHEIELNTTGPDIIKYELLNQVHNSMRKRLISRVLENHLCRVVYV